MQTEAILEKKSTPSAAVNPSKIMQVGMGFWASKVMLSAVKFGLFTLLAPRPLKANQVKERLGLATTQRHVSDWLDTLVSLGFLEREGILDEAVYSNAQDTDLFLDKNKRTYMGGILEMANNRLYKFWGDLEQGLLTGEAQNESKNDPAHNMDFFTELYKDPVKLQEFMDAMSGIQMGNFMALVNKFDFNKYATLLDVGGADGFLCTQVAIKHQRITCTTFDLPPVAPLAKKRIEDLRLADRVKVLSGDFMKDNLPKADVIVMGNILHGMNEETKIKMLQKIFDSLEQGGVFIAIENIIDKERKENTFGLLMSLNMLIENGDAFDYTMDDFESWTKKIGFSRTEIIPLTGPTSAALAYK
jgi:O-methyltransferase domain/Dimerisation domain